MMNSNLPHSDSTRRIREERQRETAFYKIMWMTANEASLAADIEDVIFECNERAIKLFGFSRGELIGMDQKDLVWDDQDREILAREHKARAEGEQSEYELRWRKKDGSMIWTEVRASPYYVGNDYSGNFGLITDVTSRKQLEEELKRNMALGKMKLSHEVKTSIGGILGCIQNILDGEVPPENQREVLELVVESGNDILTMTENVLAYGKVAGREKRDYDLNEIIKGRISQMKMGKFFDYHRLNTKFHPEPLPVRLDLLAIKVVLNNLVRNAANSTGPGEDIFIGTQQKGNFGEFYVGDRGIGLTDEEIAHLFQPHFTRGGTGMGLYVAHENAKDHGGYINVVSELGRGSKFTVGLPLINRNT